MPGQGRLGDKAQVQQDAHGCPGCPHPGVGPAIIGSATVLINGRPALRVDDVGIQAVCCGPNMWTAQEGSRTVFINGKPAFRIGDASRHCGGTGKLMEGSDNVIIGGASSGGGAKGSNDGNGVSGAAAGTGSAAHGASSAPAQRSAPGSVASDVGDGAVAARTSPVVSASAGEDGDAEEQAIGEDQLEVLVVNTHGDPEPGIVFELILPDGTMKTGTSGADGFIRVSGLQQRGDCQLIIPSARTKR
jgi:uncharacterized Zn-binding protein involved in type VI secretion